MNLALVLIAVGAVEAQTPPAQVTPAVEQKKPLGITAGEFGVKIAATLRLAQTMSSTIVLDDLGRAPGYPRHEVIVTLEHTRLPRTIRIPHANGFIE